MRQNGGIIILGMLPYSDEKEYCERNAILD